MRVEEVTYGSHEQGEQHFFSALLFKGWGFWTAGPSSHAKEHILLELSLYRDVERVILVRIYVPYVQ